MKKELKIALSTDARGHAPHATLIASILRRTALPVHVRCWCREFSPESFETGRLKVEFLRTDEEVTGRFPGQSGPAAYDRLRVIRDSLDWDRCMVMDCDQLVLCDMAPLFDMNLGGHLLAAHMQGPGVDMAYAMRVWLKRPIPDGWEHCAANPYFLMPPLLNLAAIREAGTWEKFLAAHAAFGADEQLSLTAATEGRSLPLDRKWNLFPKLHIREGEVPQGIIHWSGWPKPWHKGAKVWRPDIWESEKSSWEHLRMGLWEKPVAVEIEPENGLAVRALARRGWKVMVVKRGFSGMPQEARRMDAQDQDYPDVSKLATDELPGGPDSELDRVRFPSVFSARSLLDRWDQLPGDLVVAGPARAEELGNLKDLGYRGEFRLKPREWPTGGPSARVLNHRWHLPASGVGFGEEVYLTRRNPPDGLQNALTTSGQVGLMEPGEEAEGTPDWFPWRPPQGFMNRIGELARISRPRSILELGPGAATLHLRQCFPDAAIQAIEQDALWFERIRGILGPNSNVDLVHTPLDRTLPWHDCRDLRFSSTDLLVIHAARGPNSKAVRHGATCLRIYLATGARVIIGLEEGDSPAEQARRWLTTGGMRLETEGSDFVELRVDGPPDWIPAPERIEAMSDIAGRILVISLPEREDRRIELLENWKPLGIHPEWIEGIRPNPEEIQWREMKGMEAYGRVENLRGGYVVGATGCKRAGIAALERLLESDAATGLICQDDCRWELDALRTIQKAFLELPAGWDLVYFSASARQPYEPFSPHLVRIMGARLCTAILWKRQAAERLLPRLKECDCEWDVFMQRSHAELQVFGVVPMPAHQARSRSDITGGIVQPPNR